MTAREATAPTIGLFELVPEVADRAAAERDVLGWPGVETARGRFGDADVSVYKVGRRQLGHVHHDGVADLPFLKAVRDGPIATGRAAPHGVGFAGAVSAALEQPDDVPNLVALFRLGYDRATAGGTGGTADAHAGGPRTPPDGSEGRCGSVRIGMGGSGMGVFAAAERAYLAGQRLGRLATVGATGARHVVPVGFRHNPALVSIDVGGHDLARSKKYRDVVRDGRVAFVVDDRASIEPWRARGIEIRGDKVTLSAAGEEVGPGFAAAVIRITPRRVVARWIDDADPFRRDGRTVR